MNSPISFLWPAMLFFLLTMPLLAGLYLWLQRRRKRQASVFSQLGSTQNPGRQDPGFRRHVPAVFFLVSLAVLFLASARPQTTVSLPKQEGTVILAFDVSGSMAAEDLKPNRLEAAKAAALDFVQRQPSSVQIGVVAFSGSGLSVQTPTNDQEAILASINRLKPELGTSLAHGIQASLNALDQANEDEESSSSSTSADGALATPAPVPPGTYSSAAIVLLTDGENTAPPDPLSSAQTAADRGVRIYTIGIGSPAGITLHINDFTVHTQLDEVMLQQISQITGGAYYNAGSEQDLQKIYEELTPQLVVRPEKMEITSLLAGAGLLLMLVGGMFSLVWFGRLP
jgi:Ca-activated chloride channel family protein